MPGAQNDITSANSIYRTRFYSDCLGIFQGGGCRATAFAGAYEAAYLLGVRFSEVAGTSAGSIVAALVAAGATPAFVLQELRQLSFAEFVHRPSRRLFNDRLARSLEPIARRLGSGAAMMICAALSGGIHSSEPIAEWVDEKLRRLLGVSKGPVRFCDLQIPLYVVASDLTTMKPRVWSNHETPTMSVAHACRASCSIPLFYQPVEEGSTLLVDGGLVSNLPSFVFTLRRGSDLFAGRRMLSFVLDADQSKGRPQTPREYLGKLVSLAIDGSTDVQMRFQPDLAKIVIPTGSIQATDFETMDATKIESLIENGRRAADSFIRRELLAAREESSRVVPILDEHQAFLRLTEQLTAVRTQAIVSFPDTKWFWELFPTVFYWLKQGIRVYCFTSPLNELLAENPKEVQRRHLMTQMGVVISERTDIPFRGFMIDSGTDATSSALVFSGDRFDYESIAEYYDARRDATVLRALYDKICPLLTPEPAPAPALSMERAPDQDVISLLKRNVRQYRNPNVEITVETIPVSKVLLISRFVRAFRYQQIEAIVDGLREGNLALFEPARIRLADGSFSIVTPPVYEAVDDQYVAIEGNTRSLYSLNNGIQSIRALVVRGVQEVLPGDPTPLQQVRITSWRRRPEDRITGFNRDSFRDIERAVRPLAQR